MSNWLEQKMKGNRISENLVIKSQSILGKGCGGAKLFQQTEKKIRKSSFISTTLKSSPI
jgi:hypothetical protein